MAYVFRWEGREHGIIESTKVKDALGLSDFQAFHAVHMCQKGGPINCCIMILAIERAELYQMLPDDIQVFEYQPTPEETVATAFRPIDLVPTIVMAREKWFMSATGCFAGIDTVAMSTETFLSEFIAILNGIKIPTLKGTSGTDVRVLTLDSSRKLQMRDGFGTRVKVTPIQRFGDDNGPMDILMRILTPLFNISARIDGITTVSFTIPRPKVPMEVLYELSHHMDAKYGIRLYITPVSGNSSIEIFSFDYSVDNKKHILSELSQCTEVPLDPESIIVPDLYGFSATVIPGDVDDES